MVRLLACTAVLVLACAPGRAADSFDSCTGTITSLPAVISSPGTWCLKSNLSTDLSSGTAVLVTTNNVTIDCNGFRMGGLAAGAGTLTTGIRADDRLNVTVRRCQLRGFQVGIFITGASTAGHLIEDNRLDQMTVMGLSISGTGCSIRRNLLFNTGGSPTQPNAWGIVSSCRGATVTDNQVNALFSGSSAASDGSVTALQLATHVVASRNLITRLSPHGAGIARGIALQPDAGPCAIRNNEMFNARRLNLPIPGTGIQATLQCFCSGNRISGYQTGINPCFNAGNNFVD